MNFSELQVELRHFAAERDWQPFHTPKNLTTALMVEAAELAEIFQWMTPEESRLAHRDAGSKERIGEEVADVLLYLLQVADHSEIDVAQAVRFKLARNALKYPPRHSIARVSPARAAISGTHVLLDYENVQPTDSELRLLVPGARQVWVFHGPHQRQVEARFASFGADVTAVPISKTGKNSLDFHLAFYMGYIASRNHASAMVVVVVANDKGYEPMLEHARSMGFAARQVGYGQVKPAASAKTGSAVTSVPKKAPTKKAAAKKVPAKKVAANQPAVKVAPAKKAAVQKAAARVPAAKKAPAKKVATAKKVAARPAATTPAKKAAVAAPVAAAMALAPVGTGTKVVALTPDSAATIKKLTDSLRKMGDKRPAKPSSLWRSLKLFLGTGATEESVEVALARLIEDGVVKVDSVKGASYPRFEVQSGSAESQA